jgi:hypothetical protein
MPEKHVEESGRSRRKSRGDRPPLRRLAQYLEWAGGTIICALIIATPWMFGTTEDWSVRWMNIGGFSAGAILLAAAICNRFSGRHAKASGRDRTLKYLFLILNLAVLGFCAIAVWNARATFSVEDRSFDYRDEYNPSLPTTYDVDLTRQTLINFTACFIVFWALRYWLSQAESRPREDSAPPWQNKRFKVLIWIICLNGFAIALQGILQRLSGSAKLLWIRESWWGLPYACFGPFSYRGNAAEFLNLIWPVAIGFWWILSRERRRRLGSDRVFHDGPELLLIPATIVMIAGSVISLSRGGAVIALALLFGLTLLFVFQKKISRRARIGVAVFVLMTVGLVTFLGVGPLLKRFQHTDFKDIGGRAEIYKYGKQVANDYPVFGAGPGAFQSVYHLYRTEPGEVWHVFLHDDWLETRATFGWVGFAIILANLLVLGVWIAVSREAGTTTSFSICVAAALIGVLAHARIDFPFQTYSIFFMFVVLAATLVSVPRSR